MPMNLRPDPKLGQNAIFSQNMSQFIASQRPVTPQRDVGMRAEPLRSILRNSRRCHAIQQGQQRMDALLRHHWARMPFGVDPEACESVRTSSMNFLEYAARISPHTHIPPPPPSMHTAYRSHDTVPEPQPGTKRHLFAQYVPVLHTEAYP